MTDAAADRVPVLRESCVASSRHAAALACNAGILAMAPARLDVATGSCLVRATESPSPGTSSSNTPGGGSLAESFPRDGARRGLTVHGESTRRRGDRGDRCGDH